VTVGGDLRQHDVAVQRLHRGEPGPQVVGGQPLPGPGVEDDEQRATVLGQPAAAEAE
jgi:hypothetical protein